MSEQPVGRPAGPFRSKAAARQWAWDTLQAQRLARFPFPPHGRIPNFAGARHAAERLLGEPPWRDARALKVNPDTPQAPVRELGFPAVPVGTTVHDVQVVADFPIEPNDLPLALICTPTRTLRVADPPPAPRGIDWCRLGEAELRAMPVLAELAALGRRGSRRER